MKNREAEVQERIDALSKIMLFALNIVMRDRMFGGVKNEEKVLKRRAKNKVARRSRRVNRMRAK